MKVMHGFICLSRNIMINKQNMFFVYCQLQGDIFMSTTASTSMYTMCQY
jgi:hypothetical protein